MATENDGAPGVPLQCLMGQAAPPELGNNLSSLLALPEAVRQSFAEVLEPSLAPVIDDRVETRMKRYCRRHEVAMETVAAPVRACRFLFTNLVKAGGDRDAFVGDVNALVSESEARALLELLLPLFDAAFPKLTQAAAFQSVAEHGKVVRAVRWRMDVIKASDHGVKLDVPVATITLQFQEGPNAGQASYQLLPEQVLELKRAIAVFVE
jgi:hypothetical protein